MYIGWCLCRCCVVATTSKIHLCILAFHAFIWCFANLNLPVAFAPNQHTNLAICVHVQHYFNFQPFDWMWTSRFFFFFFSSHLTIANKHPFYQKCSVNQISFSIKPRMHFALNLPLFDSWLKQIYTHTYVHNVRIAHIEHISFICEIRWK